MIRLLSVLLVVGVVAVGCGDDDAVDTGAGPADGGGLVGDGPTGEWRLVSGIGGDGAIPMVDGYGLTLDVDLGAGRVGGTAACNDYGGQIVSIANGEWIVGGYGWTEMGCPEPGVHDSEQAYLAALVAAETYELADDTLVLRGPDTELRYAFVPPPPDAELVGPTWVLDTLLDGLSASNLAGMERSTMTLAADGTFTAVLGCNLTGGTWTREDDRLELLPADITDRACTGVEQTIEDHVLAVLGDVGFEIAGTRLTLTRDDGVGVIYRLSGEPTEN